MTPKDPAAVVQAWNEALCDFLSISSLLGRRKWVEDPDGVLRTYVRVGPRWLRGQALHTLTLASVDVREDYQRRGLFTRALGLLEQEARERGFQAVLVESVFSMQLPSILVRAGYEVLDAEARNWGKLLKP